MFDSPLPQLTLGVDLGFAAGMRVHTPGGLKPIETLRVGDAVLTHPEEQRPPGRRKAEHEYAYREVTAVAQVEVAALVHITVLNFADGIEDTLLATPGQPVWTLQHGWLAAEHLSYGHALGLSFNGHALVQHVKRVETPCTVHALEVAGTHTYYVEQLGCWVSDNLAAAPLAAPEPPMAKIDLKNLTEPQTLLHIDDYFNETLAPPKPAAADDEELAAQCRADAEKLRQIVKQDMAQDLDYDLEAVRWLEGYIERYRVKYPHDRWQGAINLIGAFLGEFTIRRQGGRWGRYEGMACVIVASGDAVFPHNKVRKQLTHGREGGDSILGFVNVNDSFAALNQPLTGAQKRLLSSVQRPGHEVFVRHTLDDQPTWTGVASAAPPWVKLVAPPGQAYTTSIGLAQVASFYVCGADGRLLHTEWVCKSDWDSLPPGVLQQLQRRLPARTTLELAELQSGTPWLAIDFAPSDKDSANRRVYATRVTNISRRRLRIRKFGGYVPENAAWQLASVTGDHYSADHFADWYGQDGDWLLPGQSVCDDTNWGLAPVLWAYHGETDAGESFIAGKVLERPLGGAGLEPPRLTPPRAEQPELAALMEELRSGFERRQQRMNSLSLASVLAAAPAWLTPDDGLSPIFTQQSLLLSEGQVSWGALVQANSLMFKPGAADCPGMVVHSDDAYFNAHPLELRLAASCIASLKGLNFTDPDMRALARSVTDESARYLSLQLPAVLSHKALKASVFMLFRRHLPNGVLSRSLFPLLSHPSTPAVMMLPFEFWPIELIVRWKEGRL